MASVRFEGVSKRFGDVAAVDGVDLTVASGELVVLVGPSGCGKSTLLRLVAGLETPTDGDIWIGEDRVTDEEPARRGVSMVFQSYALYPHMTVHGNIAFGLKLAGTARDRVDQRVRAVARMLEIDGLLDRKPRALSGGQRQRVAIARALVREPRVFLLDEPLSNLDAALRVQTRIELARMHRDLGTTMLYVTHDQVEAMTLADRMVVLNAGRVEQVGAPADLYRQPANLFVAGFLGTPRMNLLPAVFAGGSARLAIGPEGARRAVAGVTVPGDGTGTIGIRAEDLTLEAASDAAVLTGRVDLVEELGEARIVHVAIDGGPTVAVRHPGDHAPGPGERIGLGPARPDGGRWHLFDAGGLRIGP